MSAERTDGLKEWGSREAEEAPLPVDRPLGEPVAPFASRSDALHALSQFGEPAASRSEALHALSPFGEPAAASDHFGYLLQTARAWPSGSAFLIFSRSEQDIWRRVLGRVARAFTFRHDGGVACAAELACCRHFMDEWRQMLEFAEQAGPFDILGPACVLGLPGSFALWRLHSAALADADPDFCSNFARKLILDAAESWAAADWRALAPMARISDADRAAIAHGWSLTAGDSSAGTGLATRHWLSRARDCLDGLLEHGLIALPDALNSLDDLLASPTKGAQSGSAALALLEAIGLRPVFSDPRWDATWRSRLDDAGQSSAAETLWPQIAGWVRSEFDASALSQELGLSGSDASGSPAGSTPTGEQPREANPDGSATTSPARSALRI